MTTPRDELNTQTGRAMVAALQAKVTFDTAMAAYRLDEQALTVLLELPRPVEHAVAEFHTALNHLAALIALGAGDLWDRLPLTRKQAYQREAFTLVTRLGQMPAAAVFPDAITGPAGTAPG